MLRLMWRAMETERWPEATRARNWKRWRQTSRNLTTLPRHCSTLRSQLIAAYYYKPGDLGGGAFLRSTVFLVASDQGYPRRFDRKAHASIFHVDVAF
jgi:hypothetical protein